MGGWVRKWGRLEILAKRGVTWGKYYYMYMLHRGALKFQSEKQKDTEILPQ